MLSSGSVGLSNVKWRRWICGVLFSRHCEVIMQMVDVNSAISDFEWIILGYELNFTWLVCLSLFEVSYVCDHIDGWIAVFLFISSPGECSTRFLVRIPDVRNCVLVYFFVSIVMRILLVETSGWGFQPVTVFCFRIADISLEFPGYFEVLYLS